MKTKTILIFIFCGLGIILFLLSKIPSVTNNQELSNILEGLGIGLFGYGAVESLIILVDQVSEWSTERRIDKLFKTTIKEVETKRDLPLFFAIDISGLITPSDRGEINLRKLQRLRSYCNFVKDKRHYPPLVLFTGRSQGYVELMIQVLGLLDMPYDLPHIIENGSALYRATAKRVISLISAQEIDLLHKVQSLITKEFPQNELEPKSYMVTINTLDVETIGELREKIVSLLAENNLRDSLYISSSMSAVDLTPKGATKINALNEVLKFHTDEAREHNLQNIVSLGDTVSDIDVLRATGRAYCPAERVDLEVRKYIQTNFGDSYIVKEKDIDIVIHVIEKECGLRIL